MICHKCQAAVFDDANFCVECGIRLSEGKGSTFLVYRKVALFELFAVAALVLAFAVAYFGYNQRIMLPEEESQTKVVVPQPPKPVPKEVFYSEWAAHPDAYKGKPIHKGGLVSEVYTLKGSIAGLKVETVPIGAHGGWIGPVYVICVGTVPQVEVSDIVQLKGTGAGKRQVSVTGAGKKLITVDVPALQADSIDIVSKSTGSPQR